MKIQYASDLHWEFKENYYRFLDFKLQPVGDILILGGDILLLKLLSEDEYKYREFFQFFSDNYKAVYWLLGNHEYYHYELTNKIGVFKEEVYKNVFLINNTVEYFEDCRIIFSTLWSEIEQINEKYMQRFMSDFHVIRYNGMPIRASDYNKLFAEDFGFIQAEIAKPFFGKTIVVTHHVPTMQNYPAEFINSPLNNGFATDLTDFIRESSIDYWIYGHHHRNIADFTIGRTIMTTNQMGYIHQNENKGFDRAKLLTATTG